MAKFTTSTLLLALLGSFALPSSAQTYNTSAPFTLQLESDNATLAGQSLGACHSGAAIEELCLAGVVTDPDYSYTFYFNVSASEVVAAGQYETGIIFWILHGSGFNLSEPLTFGTPPLDTNVVPPLFEPSDEGASLAFDDDDKLFIYSEYYDDTTFVPGDYPTQITPIPLYRVSFV